MADRAHASRRRGRALLWVIVVVVVVVVLLVVVFPRVTRFLQDPTMDSALPAAAVHHGG